MYVKSFEQEPEDLRYHPPSLAVAEFVEGRGGNKRNAGLQSTGRTQSRETVSKAQGRIREAVTRNRGEKLTALLHHISVDYLRLSYFELKKTAATGVDGITWREM